MFHFSKQLDITWKIGYVELHSTSVDMLMFLPILIHEYFKEMVFFLLYFFVTQLLPYFLL